MRRAAELCHAAADRAGEAQTYFILSYVCWLQADHDRALEHAQRSLALWAELQHPGWEGRATSAVGWYHAELGAYHTALPYYHRALALHEQSGELANQALVRDNLGRIHDDMGHHQTAADHYQHGLRLARAAGSPIMQLQLALHLGDTYQSMGDHASAREYWQESFQILSDAAHPLAADVGRKIDTLPPPSGENLG
jgi:tetratricopeptide (TPR) repeat protein